LKVQESPPLHLTYCLNVHRGETWEENFAAIRQHTLRVRARVAPDQPFGLGLRLSRRAADELGSTERLQAFRDFLGERDLYVFTINGFPYGTFHDQPVKEAVYEPDWRTAERLDYASRLAEILARLLPEGVAGSISTVPGSYGAWIQSREDVDAMVRQLTACVERLAQLHDATGKLIHLGLEPEPDCFLSTVEAAEAFIRGPLRSGADGRTQERLARHLGVCVDTCHLAVQFEDPTSRLLALQAAGIRVSKIQLSAALQVRPTPAVWERLQAFCDPIYLHQVRARDGLSYPDLSDIPRSAFRDPRSAGGEWRVHFHVPLFFQRDGEIESTAAALDDDFFAAVRRGVTEHLEIETYTFHVLPDALRAADVVDSLVREFEWARARLPAVC